jgi:RNA recognition motif-containing protein
MIGDLPEAEVKPPSNMLFICKLNPVTTEEDLEIIFSRCVITCDMLMTYVVTVILVMICRGGGGACAGAGMMVCCRVTTSGGVEQVLLD